MRRFEPERDARVLVAAAALLAAISLTALLLAGTTAFASALSHLSQFEPGRGAVGAVVVDDAIPDGWAVIAGAPGTDTDTRLVLRRNGIVDGRVCSQRAQLGAATVRDADVVATDAELNAIRLRAAASVLGDVVTGGGNVRSLPRGTDLPGIDTSLVVGGEVVEREDGVGVYDTTGTDPRVAACDDAQEAATAGATTLDGLVPDSVLGKIAVPGDATFKVTTPRPGEVGVIELRRVKVGARATLELSGGGVEGGTLVVRVTTRLRARVDSQIVLSEGLDASRVVIYVAGERCLVGERVRGAGTLMCPRGQVRLLGDTTWDGSLIGGLGKVDIGARVVVTGVGFEGGS